MKPINTRHEAPLAELYTAYADRVYNLAFRMTGDPDLSEDICQETFIQVFTNLSSFRGESGIFTWIFAIARNICLRHLAKQRRASFRSIESLIQREGVPGDGGGYVGPEREFYIAQVKDGCLLGVLRCLSFNQRLAFILSVLFDLSASETAAVLGKSPNSTRILIHRARNNIRGFLCGNCSWYDKGNRCRCENLISFSLKQGWIKKYNPSVTPAVIESEIKEFKSEVLLYRTLPPVSAGDALGRKIIDFINEKDFTIFSRTKVK